MYCKCGEEYRIVTYKDEDTKKVMVDFLQCSKCGEVFYPEKNSTLREWKKRSKEKNDS